MGEVLGDHDVAAAPDGSAANQCVPGREQEYTQTFVSTKAGTFVQFLPCPRPPAGTTADAGRRTGMCHKLQHRPVGLVAARVRGEKLPNDSVHRSVVLQRTHPSTLQQAIIERQRQVRYAGSVTLDLCDCPHGGVWEAAAILSLKWTPRRADTSWMHQRDDTDRPARYDGPERRASQPRLYSIDQLLGRSPIRLRRRTDKMRLAAHALAAIVMVGLTAWWVLPRHWFAGPVLVTFAPGRGVHVGDLPALVYLAVALRSLHVMARIVRRQATVS